MKKYRYSKKMKKQMRRKRNTKVLKTIGKGCLIFLAALIGAIIVMYCYLYGECEYLHNQTMDWVHEAREATHSLPADNDEYPWKY